MQVVRLERQPDRIKHHTSNSPCVSRQYKLISLTLTDNTIIPIEKH